MATTYVKNETKSSPSSARVRTSYLNTVFTPDKQTHHTHTPRLLVVSIRTTDGELPGGGPLAGLIPGLYAQTGRWTDSARLLCRRWQFNLQTRSLSARLFKERQ